MDFKSFQGRELDPAAPDVATNKATKKSEEDLACETFSISLILENIFGRLTLEDLKQCRQVNSLWKLEATKTLLKNNITKTCTLTSERDLISTILSADVFPCNSFRIQGASLLSPEIQQVASHVGEYVKELEILNPGRIQSLSFDDVKNFLTQTPKLQILTIDGNVSYGKEFQISPMPNLKKFIWSDETCYSYVQLFEGYGGIFYSEHTLIEDFPNLEEIVVNKDPNAPEDYRGLEKCRSSGRSLVPHLNVQRLTIPPTRFLVETMSLPVLQYFTEKFPNLTHASFPPIRDFYRASQYIWTNLVHLKQLNVSIYGSTLEKCFPAVLEAAFTGFSIQTCRLILQDIAQGIDINESNHAAEVFRINKSILNLKDLTSLTITFEDDSTWYTLSPERPLLTSLTGCLAFSKCPNLEVTIDLYFKQHGFGSWTEDLNPFLGVKPWVSSVNFYPSRARGNVDEILEDLLGHE